MELILGQFKRGFVYVPAIPAATQTTRITERTRRSCLEASETDREAILRYVEVPCYTGRGTLNDT